MRLDEFTLIVPYYRNPQMLERQTAEWERYPDEVRVVVVDDGSPEPAQPIVEGSRAHLYRILEDKPWNREGARNLGATVAETEWILHVDIDHILPANSAYRLLESKVDPQAFYRFERYRCGAADETRRKDKIPDDVEFGKIHPHVDSYLITKTLFWRFGGYDEDYVGCLGGGAEYVRGIEKFVVPGILPIPLHVYTRSKIRDASDMTLSRDVLEFKRRRNRKIVSRNTKPNNPLRFDWTRQI